MKVLFGNYDLTVDEKNRLLIPVEVRRAMDPVVDGEAFFMVTGLNGRPWLWPEKKYEAHAENRGSEIAPTEANLEFDHLTFAFAVKLEIDKQGKIRLSRKETIPAPTGSGAKDSAGG